MGRTLRSGVSEMRAKSLADRLHAAEQELRAAIGLGGLSRRRAGHVVKAIRWLQIARLELAAEALPEPEARLVTTDEAVRRALVLVWGVARADAVAELDGLLGSGTPWPEARAEFQRMSAARAEFVEKEIAALSSALYGHPGGDMQ